MPIYGNQSHAVAVQIVIGPSQGAFTGLFTMDHDATVVDIAAYIQTAAALPAPQHEPRLEVDDASSTVISYGIGTNSGGVNTTEEYHVPSSSFYGGTTNVVYAGQQYRVGAAYATNTNPMHLWGATGSVWDLWVTTALATAPTAPTISSVTFDPTLTQATVNWGAATGIISSWQLEKSTNGGSTWGTVASGIALSTHSYTDTSVAAGPLSYRVRSVNTEANAAGPAFTIASPSAPGTPSISQTITPSLSLSLAWTPATATSTQPIGSQSVQRSLNGTTWTTVASVSPSAASYTDATVAPGTTYYYRLTDDNSVGSTAGTASAAFTTAATSAPSVSVSQNAALNQSTIYWVSSGVTTSYTLEKSVNGGASWTTLAAGLPNTTLNWTDTAVVAGPLRYRVTSSYAGGSASTVFVVTAPPSTGGPTLSSQQVPLGVILSWSPVAVLGNQTVMRSPNGTTGWTAMVSNLGSTANSYTDLSVTVTTTYYYRIDAANSVGTSTGVVSAPITTAAPAMTMTLTPQYPSAANALRVLLSWQALPGTVTGYIPQRSTDNVTWTPLSASQLGTSYSDTSVAPGAKYFYRVQGTSTVGTLYSPVYGCYSPGPVAPVAPTLVIDPYMAGVVDVFWPPVISTLPPTYIILRAPHGGTFVTVAQGISGGFWQDTVPSAGAWDYLVVSTDVPVGVTLPYGGYTPFGPLATVTVPNLPVTTLTLIQTTNTLNVVIAWTAVAGATGYIVQRSTDQGRTWANITGSIVTTTATDTSVAAFTRYWYRVYTASSGGSAFSTARSIFVDTGGPIHPGFRFIIGGSDYSGQVDSLKYPQLDRQVAGQGMTLRVGVHFEPGPNTLVLWQPVDIFFNREHRFSGWATSLSRISTAPGVEDVEILAQDAVFALSSTVVTEVFEQVPADIVIKDLILRYVPGLTVFGVRPGPLVSFLAVTDQPVMTAIRSLLSLGAVEQSTPLFRVGDDLDITLTFTPPATTGLPQLTDATLYTGALGT